MQSFFVSSTFKDMQGERDALHKIVLPHLREKAKAYGQNVQFVDLRWGISTEDMDSDAGASKIMEVCLDEIENCKPYMIVLLGERYGWMPDVNLLQQALDKKKVPIECRPMSITEMEIQYGMLRNSEALDHCIFCMRDKLAEENIPKEVLESMVCQTEDEKVRLEQLKEHIRQTEHVHILEYRLAWDTQKQIFTGYDGFAERLTESLERLMTDEWGEAMNRSWQERQWMDDKLLQDTLTGCFYGRDAEVEAALKKLNDTQVYVLEAEGGSGKSAFVSAMAQRIPNAHVIYCGNSGYCTTVEQLLQVLCWRVGACMGCDTPEIGSIEKWKEQWDTFASLKRKTPLTIIIDAIDQLYGDDALFQSWYLPAQMSDMIKIIVTTTGTVQVNPQALSGINYIRETLTPPNDADRLLIIQEMFYAEHKQISTEIEDAILANPCSKNMLALSMMVRRLMMLGEKDFREIQKLEKSMDGDTAIRTYLLKLIHDFSADLYVLMDDYLWAVCNYLDEGKEGDNNRIMLYLIATTENGLSRADFEQLQKYVHSHEKLSKNQAWSTFWNELKFSRAKHFLGSLLMEKSDGKIDFTHRLLREGFRTNHAVKYCCYVLLEFLRDGEADERLKFDNTIPLSRQCLMIEKEDGDNLLSTPLNYIVPIIKDAGNRSNEEDPKVAECGEAELKILEKSILMDISKDHGRKVFDTYCDMLRHLIERDHGPRYWAIWFFESRIAISFWDQGDSGKTKAIQIYLAILSSFMAKEKKETREAFDELDSRALCRMFMYAHRLYKLLVSSIQHERIHGQSYGYEFSALYKDGKAWFAKHLEKYPHDRKALGWGIAFYSDQAFIESDILGGPKDVKKAEEYLSLYKKSADFSNAFQCRQYVIRNAELCETYIKMHWNAFIHGKKYLELAQKRIEEAQAYYEVLPEDQRTYTAEIRLYTMLAEVYKRTDRLKEGLEVLWRCYCRIEQSDRRFTDDERAKYSDMIMSLIGFLFRYKKVSVDGMNKYHMAKEVLKHESGYIRANVNENFASRYHWAQILRLRAYCKEEEGKSDYKDDLEEAKKVLRPLAAEQKKSTRGIDTWKYNAQRLLEIIEAE